MLVRERVFAGLLNVQFWMTSIGLYCNDWYKLVAAQLGGYVFFYIRIIEAIGFERAAPTIKSQDEPKMMHSSGEQRTVW